MRRRPLTPLALVAVAIHASACPFPQSGTPGSGSMIQPEPMHEPVKGDPAVIVAFLVGVAVGIATNVAAAVYALDDRAFDSPWIVASLFSSAMCMGLTIGLVVNQVTEAADTGRILAIPIFTALAAWPAYWTIKTAYGDVDPGERFDAIETSKEIQL